MLASVIAVGLTSRSLLRSELERLRSQEVEQQLTKLEQEIPAQLASNPALIRQWCEQHPVRDGLEPRLFGQDGQEICGHPVVRSDDLYSAFNAVMGVSRVQRPGDPGAVVFVSKRLNNGLVLRAGASLQSIDQAISQLLRTGLWFGVPILLLIALWGVWSLRVLTSAARNLPVEDPVVRLRADLSREREQLAALVGALTEPVIGVDREERVLFYNSPFALLYGVRGSASSGMRLWELVRDPGVLESFQGALGGGAAETGRVLSIEPAAVATSGKKFYSLSVAPLTRNKNQVFGAIGVFHDVTGLKNAEALRIDFVANASHELRTPVTLIKGYTDTLAMDLKAGRPVDPTFVEVLQRNVDRMALLMSDLLDISALDSGEVMEREVVEVDSLTRKAISALQERIQAKKQTLKIQDHGVHKALLDGKRVEQIVTNLVDNAHKYSPEGAALDITWERAASGDVLLRVRDNGPGIPLEHQARLFERFFRVDRGRSREMGGTGLGLAIVKHIVQSHGGQAWVESLPGQGACFVCRFPSQEIA